MAGEWIMRLGHIMACALAMGGMAGCSQWSYRGAAPFAESIGARDYVGMNMQFAVDRQSEYRGVASSDTTTVLVSPISPRQVQSSAD